MNHTQITQESADNKTPDTLEVESLGLAHRSPHTPMNDQGPIYSNFFDDDLYQDLIEFFVVGLHKEIGAIQDAISEGKPHLISQLAHKIRGTAATFGYPAFASVSQEIESAMRNLKTSSLSDADHQHLTTLVHQMSSLYSRMLAAIPQR